MSNHCGSGRILVRGVSLITGLSRMAGHSRLFHHLVVSVNGKFCPVIFIRLDGVGLLPGMLASTVKHPIIPFEQSIKSKAHATLRVIEPMLSEWGERTTLLYGLQEIESVFPERLTTAAAARFPAAHSNLPVAFQ